jgi:hypothetical protein
MIEKPEGGDIVDRAIAALRATAGPDEPPRDVVKRVRFQEKKFVATGPIRRGPSPVPKERIAWITLAAAVLLMTVTGWLVAFHATLFSQVAAEHVSPDGTVYRFYTDGNVKIDVGRGRQNHPG